MSKIGKLPISLPTGVSVELTNDLARVKGPKGELTAPIPAGITVKQEGDQVLVTRANDEKSIKSLHGLTRSLINNHVQGVVSGYTKTLEINGVGYKAEMSGDKLVLSLGFSHPVNLAILPGVEVKVEKNIVTVSGIDKQAVGQMAAVIRSLKKPEPYKGKGIKYSDEVIKRKAGKAAKTA
jgi:large subunit ribosomal protein L6